MNKIEIETHVTRKNSQFHSYMPNVVVDLDDKDTVFTADAIWRQWFSTLSNFVDEKEDGLNGSGSIEAEVAIHGISKESPKYVIDVIRQFVTTLIAKGFSVKSYGTHEFLLPAVYVGLSYSGNFVDTVYVIRPWSLDSKALFEAVNDSCITSVRNYLSYDIDWLWWNYNKDYDYKYEKIADKVVSVIKKGIDIDD